MALLARQEASTLPQSSSEDDSAMLSLLTTEREAAPGEATRLGNQIHALLMRFDPEYHGYLPTLRSQAVSCRGTRPR
jgi:hypothetical protein